MSRKFFWRPEDYRSLDTAVTQGYQSPAQTQNHAVARLRCSLVAGINLTLSAKSGLIVPGSQVRAKGAGAQDDKGAVPRPAAHALPCGLTIANRHVFTYGGANRPLVEFLALPFSVTNVVPRATNLGDSRAERFRMKDGLGLVTAFERFGQANTFLRPGEGAQVELSRLQQFYFQLVDDYVETFRRLLASLPEQQMAGKTMVDSHVELDPETFSPTSQEAQEEDVRLALRQQLTATQDAGKGMLRPAFVEEVQEGFHEAQGAGLQAPSSEGSSE